MLGKLVRERGLPAGPRAFDVTPAVLSSQCKVATATVIPAEYSTFDLIDSNLAVSRD